MSSLIIWLFSVIPYQRSCPSSTGLRTQFPANFKTLHCLVLRIYKIAGKAAKIMYAHLITVRLVFLLFGKNLTKKEKYLLTKMLKLPLIVISHSNFCSHPFLVFSSGTSCSVSSSVLVYRSTGVLLFTWLILAKLAYTAGCSEFDSFLQTLSTANRPWMQNLL
jgi:hypothetical protein